MSNKEEQEPLAIKTARAIMEQAKQTRKEEIEKIKKAQFFLRELFQIKKEFSEGIVQFVFEGGARIEFRPNPNVPNGEIRLYVSNLEAHPLSMDELASFLSRGDIQKVDLEILIEVSGTQVLEINEIKEIPEAQ